MTNKIKQLRESIAYVLIKEGEASSNELARKLHTEATSVAVALKEMFDAGEVTRVQVWKNSKRSFVYRHRSSDIPALTGTAHKAAELARYVTLDGKRVAKLTDDLLAQVQLHAKDGSSMRFWGPDPATQQARNDARTKGMALPTRQHLTMDIVKYAAPAEPAVFGLSAPNKRTLDHFLLWHPEFKLDGH